MNESVYRTPKWMRGFADFEINTGEDIKGKPSKRRQRKIDKENKRKEEKRKEREEQQRKEREEQKQKEFQNLYDQVKLYIQQHYDKCDIDVPKNGVIEIYQDKLKYSGKSLSFRLKIHTVNGTAVTDATIWWGDNEYSYQVSGLINLTFITFVMDIVYVYIKDGVIRKKVQKVQKKLTLRKNNQKITI